MRILFLFLILFSCIANAEENTSPIINSTIENTDSEDDIEKLLAENTTQYDWEELDPFEEHNKNVLSFNMFLFRKTLLPTIFFIDSWAPKKARKGFTNFINNLIEPRNAFIYRLNKNNKRERIALKRFLTNTVFGMLGLVNVAELRWGAEYKSKRLSLDCVFRKKHKLGRYVIVPITNQYFERPLIADTFDILMNPVFYMPFPWNYVVYAMDKVVTLGKDKTMLHRNRKYNEGIYKALRDVEIHDALSDDSCY